MMTNRIVRESFDRKGRHRITVLEYDIGEVVLYINDTRTGIQEEIALREYVHAYEIYYDIDEGWMANGQEIPYLECF